MRRPRGNTTARGYGRQHQLLRACWAPYVAAGIVDCWRCGERIQAGAPWDLGHDDVDRGRYTGPEHAACNRATNRKHTDPPGRSETRW